MEDFLYSGKFSLIRDGLDIINTRAGVVFNSSMNLICKSKPQCSHIGS